MDKYKLSSESQKNQNGIIILGFFFQTDLYKKIFFLICELHSLSNFKSSVSINTNF